MNKKTYNGYRIMWLYVCFDLPQDTKTDRRNYRRFVKVLEKDGFSRFQYSIFIRCCPSRESAEAHITRITKKLPPKGEIAVLRVTDKQFERMKIFRTKKRQKPPEVVQQLELF